MYGTAAIQRSVPHVIRISKVERFHPNLEHFQNHKCRVFFDKWCPNGQRNDADIHYGYVLARDWTGWPPGGVIMFSAGKVRNKGVVEENAKDLLLLAHVHE